MIVDPLFFYLFSLFLSHIYTTASFSHRLLPPFIDRQDTYRRCCLEIANVLLSCVQLEGKAVQEITALLTAALPQGGLQSPNPLGRKTDTPTTIHWRGEKKDDKARHVVNVDRYAINTIAWMRKTINREERTAAVGSARQKQIMGMKAIIKALPLSAANA